MTDTLQTRDRNVGAQVSSSTTTKHGRDEELEADNDAGHQRQLRRLHMEDNPNFFAKYVWATDAELALGHTPNPTARHGNLISRYVQFMVSSAVYRVEQTLHLLSRPFTHVA
jgi:hypothetical protein